MFKNLIQRPKLKGFTILELIICIALVLFLTTTLIILVNPSSAKARARDEKKLSDISKFDVEVSTYKLEHYVYTDLTPPPGVTYVHTNDAYELNTTLEYYSDKAQNDGGNNPSVYEIGNDLDLI